MSIDGNGTWTYTNKNGISVSYPNGCPDFSAFYHLTIKPAVTIEITIPKNPQADSKKANLEAGLNKDSDPPVTELNQPPTGYTWHHHEDGKTMVLVDEDIHREFRHIGGQSTVNGKNDYKGELPWQRFITQIKKLN
ncbi:HNH endonuclease [Paenibacillus sp. FSL k6-2145]|uniref:HNH endonuclease n=1 Tax=Paenibacillus TaxID=44249 RepID=UPI0030DD1C3D